LSLSETKILILLSLINWVIQAIPKSEF